MLPTHHPSLQFFGIHIGVQVAFIAAMLPFLIMTAKLLAALLRNLTGDPSAEAALEQATAPPRASDVGYGARPARPERPSPSRAPDARPPAADGSDVVAVPVREQPAAGTRTGPRPDAQPQATFTATEEGDVWHATVRALVLAEAITALVRELALQSQLIARDGKHWMLRVESASLNLPNSRERLRVALETAGHADMLSVEVGTVSDSPARRNAAAAAARQRKAEEIVTNDPFVQEMMRDFGAKIVPGTLKVRPLQNGTPA